MIRWSYAAPRLVLLALVWAFGAFFMDSLLRRAVEKYASRALGAKVEIGGLRSRVFPPSVRIEGLSAADPGDPWKNLVEFSRADLAIEGRPLLERKFVVRAAELDGLTWATTRKTSGALPKAPPSPVAEKLRGWAEDSRKLALDKVGQVKSDAAAKVSVDPKDLASLKLADQAREEFAAASDAWDKKLEDLDLDARIKEIEQAAQALQGGGDPLSKVAKAKELQEKVQALRRSVEEGRKGVEAELAKAKDGLKAVEAAKRGDLDALLEKLNLPSLDAERLSAYLLGPEASRRLAKALRLLEAARARMPAKGTPSPPPAARGSDIEFPKERSWPSFWLRSAKLSGTAPLGEPLAFSGEAADLSSNPPLVGKPSLVRLSGKDKSRVVLVGAMLDHSGAEPVDEVSFSYAGVPVPELSVGDPTGFGLTIAPGTAQVAGRIGLRGSRLSGKIRFLEGEVSMKPSFGPSAAHLQRWLGGAFAGLKVLEAELELSGTPDAPSLRVRTNLGAAMANALKGAAGKELEAKRKELAARVDKLVKERTGDLSGRLDDRSKELLGRLGAGDERLKALQGRLTGGFKLPLKLPF